MAAAASAQSLQSVPLSAPAPAGASLLSRLKVQPRSHDAVLVARVGAAFGVQGWMHVHTYSADPQVLFARRRWLISAPKPATGCTTFSMASSHSTYVLCVRECKPHGDGIVAWAQAVDDRASAESLKNWDIWVPRSDFPSLANDEYYWVDLPGLQVRNLQGQCLGTVETLLQAGPQTTLQILRPGDPKQQRILIPFVKQFICTVDLTTKTLVADWQLDW